MRVSTRSSDILAMKVVAFAFAHTVRERDVVRRVDGNCLRGCVRTAVRVRTRNGVGTRIADGYGRIGGSVAPHVRARARSREGDVIILTETAVAANIDSWQRVYRHGNVCRGGAALRVGGGYGIDTALAYANIVVRTAVAPSV